jgi:hypothetical protein
MFYFFCNFRKEFLESCPKILPETLTLQILFQAFF